MSMKSLAILAALLAPAPIHARAYEHSVTATVGWSEWCPPGLVTIDFRSGQYRWIQQNPRPGCTRQKTATIADGTLDSATREVVADSVREALHEGLLRSECKSAGGSSAPVISNAGPPYVLAIATPNNALAAPGDLSCWTPAAIRLQRLLGRFFELPRAPRR